MPSVSTVYHTYYTDRRFSHLFLPVVRAVHATLVRALSARVLIITPDLASLGHRVVVIVTLLCVRKVYDVSVWCSLWYFEGCGWWGWECAFDCFDDFSVPCTYSWGVFSIRILILFVVYWYFYLFTSRTLCVKFNAWNNISVWSFFIIFLVKVG